MLLPDIRYQLYLLMKSVQVDKRRASATRTNSSQPTRINTLHSSMIYFNNIADKVPAATYSSCQIRPKSQNGFTTPSGRQSRQSTHTKVQTAKKLIQDIDDNAEEQRQPIKGGIHRKAYSKMPKASYIKPPRSSLSESLQAMGCVKNEEIFDESLMMLIDITQRGKGFKGATNTHSRNQLLYLTCQKRFRNSEKELDKVKKDLYQLIKTEDFESIQQPSKIVAEAPPPEQQHQQSFIQYLTEYNPSGVCQEQTQPSGLRQRKILHSNIIRERLKKQKPVQSAYRLKMKCYNMIFNGSQLLC